MKTRHPSGRDGVPVPPEPPNREQAPLRPAPNVELERPAPSRREALASGLAAAAGAAIPGLASARAATTEGSIEDRMRAPDDGKRYGWIVDTRRCFGCHACEVACKAENDVPLGHYIRQTIYQDHAPASGGLARIMVPMACQHCEDAPCIRACPCGALHKGSGGSVQIDYDVCSGHAACKDACPYGAIYIDPVANQAVKCHNCTHRIDVGMEPACVATCPSESLVFGDLADPDSRISRLSKRLESEKRLETLRPEKDTRPRMRFAVDERHPMATWEPRVPREGESYSPETYSVFNWAGDASGEKDAQARREAETETERNRGDDEHV